MQKCSVAKIGSVQLCGISLEARTSERSITEYSTNRSWLERSFAPVWFNGSQMPNVLSETMEPQYMRTRMRMRMRIVLLMMIQRMTTIVIDVDDDGDD